MKPRMSIEITDPTPIKKKKKKVIESKEIKKDKKEKKVKKVSSDVKEKELKKKKKKKIKNEESNELAGAVALLGSKRISKLSNKGLNSIVGDEAESLQQLLEAGEADSALERLNKRLIQTCVDLIAEVENGIRESKGRYGVHSFNGLVQSIRELMQDLQLTRDRGAMGATLVENVIRPAMLDIGMAVLREYSTILQDVKDLGASQSMLRDFKERQVESRTRIGQAIQDTYKQLSEETVKFMQH